MTEVSDADAVSMYRSERVPGDCRHLLVACYPKSGSTYLSRLIAHAGGFTQRHLSDGEKGGEHYQKMWSCLAQWQEMQIRGLRELGEQGMKPRPKRLDAGLVERRSARALWHLRGFQRRIRRTPPRSSMRWGKWLLGVPVNM